MVEGERVAVSRRGVVLNGAETCTLPSVWAGEPIVENGSRNSTIRARPTFENLSS